MATEQSDEALSNLVAELRKGVQAEELKWLQDYVHNSFDAGYRERINLNATGNSVQTK